MLALIDLGDSAGGPAGRHWVLDPIDGTRGFVGLRQYAVCLGMLQDGEVRCRMTHPGLPSYGRLFRREPVIVTPAQTLRWYRPQPPRPAPTFLLPATTRISCELRHCLSALRAMPCSVH